MTGETAEGTAADCMAVCDLAGCEGCGECSPARRLAVVAAATTAKKQGSRVRGRPFQPGVSGNPAGRPPGSRNKMTMFAAQLLDLSSDAVMAKVIEMGLAGKPIAIRMLVERIYPARAARDRYVVLPNMPAIEHAGDLPAAVACVIGAVTRGEISASEGREAMAMIESARKAIETAELAVKIELLEQGMGGKPQAGGPVGFVPAEGVVDNSLSARIRRLPPVKKEGE